MLYKAIGKLHEAFPVQQVSENFKKQEFILRIEENPQYPQYIRFEASQERLPFLATAKKGDEMEILFALKGKEWASSSGEIKYFCTLEARVIRKSGAAGSPEKATVTVTSDDVPF